jgi:hypothetical protein
MSAKTMDKNMPNDLISIQEAAELAGVSPDAVWQYKYKDKYKDTLPFFEKDGKAAISRSAWLKLRETVKAGRKAGASASLDDDSNKREMIAIRTNQKTGTEYRVYKDSSTDPTYWVHCVEHGLQIGAPTQRKAIEEMLPKPWNWCDKCKAAHPNLK